MTPQTRLWNALSPLSASGVVLFRNPTIAFAIPPAGAVTMRDAGQTNADRSLTDMTYFTHRAELQLFIPAGQVKTLSVLEADVAAVLRADRTLGGSVDQMFLVPMGWESLPGGEGIDASAFAVQIEYSAAGVVL